MAKNPRTDEVGKVYGRLRVMAVEPCSVRTRWLCVCACGNFKAVDGVKLRSGHTQSCGCIRSEKVYRTHGHSATKHSKSSPTYVSWVEMHKRCRNPEVVSYSNYGGKGIKVCDRWKVFENFLADMGERPEGKTLDRKQSHKDYEKDNCRWATRAEQSRNRSSVLDIEYQGEAKPLSVWCEILKIPYNKTYYLVRTRKLPLKDALVKLKTLKGDM